MIVLYFYLEDNRALSFGTTVSTMLWEVNRKYNMAMDSVRYAVGYNS